MIKGENSGIFEIKWKVQILQTQLETQIEFFSCAVRKVKGSPNTQTINIVQSSFIPVRFELSLFYVLIVVMGCPNDRTCSPPSTRSYFIVNGPAKINRRLIRQQHPCLIRLQYDHYVVISLRTTHLNGVTANIIT